MSRIFLESILAGPSVFFEKTNIKLPTPFTEFPESIEHALNHWDDSKKPSPFTSYAIITHTDPTYIGQCGLIYSHDLPSTVEIGYEIAQEYKNKGYANECIQGLISLTFSESQMHTITAHTLAHKNASNHLLIKNHFVFDRAIHSTDDGFIWRWILTRKMHLIKQIFY